MTYEEILAEIKEDHDDDGEYDGSYDYENSDYLEEVSQEEWTQNHKSQYRETIYWDPKHNVHVAVNEGRSGSYHTDWYYEPAEVQLVEKRERVVTQTVVDWIVLKSGEVDPQPMPGPCASK